MKKIAIELTVEAAKKIIEDIERADSVVIGGCRVRWGFLEGHWKELLRSIHEAAHE